MSDHIKPLRVIILAVVLTALLVSSMLWLASEPSDDRRDGGLTRFQSYPELHQYLSSLSPDGYYGQESGAKAVSQDLANSHSETNIQVAGVDELDTVKTDGRYLFIASAWSVDIVLAYPVDQLTNMSSLSVNDLTENGTTEFASIIGLYLYDDRLIVVASIQEYYDAPQPYESFIYSASKGRSMVITVDISDPSNPAILDRTAISGDYITSRMIGDHVHILTSYFLWTNDAIVVPNVWSGGSKAELEPTEIMYDGTVDDATTYTNVLSMDVSTFESKVLSIITGYSSVIYVSGQNIYLTFVDWGHSSIDGVVISFEMAAMPTTTIYRVALSGLEATLAAKGEVLGFLLNQFAMDEKDGSVRLATCSGWTNQENMVYILNENLTVRSSIRGIALNESIQSARFIDDTLYLVTFQRTDPLFIIDLSDPDHPQILGELVLPGFSSYLHPFGEDLLIGVGTESNSFKVSLFDVSDPHNPVLLDNLTLGYYSWSEAQWDHKAVLFDETSGMLVLPIIYYDLVNWTYTQAFIAMSISEDGIELRAELMNGDNESPLRSVIIEDVLYTISTNSINVWNMEEMDQLGRLIYNDHGPQWYWYRLWD